MKITILNYKEEARRDIYNVLKTINGKPIKEWELWEVINYGRCDWRRIATYIELDKIKRNFNYGKRWWKARLNELLKTGDVVTTKIKNGEHGKGVHTWYYAKRIKKQMPLPHYSEGEEHKDLRWVREAR